MMMMALIEIDSCPDKRNKCFGLEKSILDVHIEVWF